ncbi:MAG: serine/threonine protein kinase [Verrucomicrobia bacterium]|nr:serine/threonine protein kinase [Verrucomicrobiota bacterium]
MLESKLQSDFEHLTPDLVLQVVEEQLGRRSSNICRPLNSYINRVYDIGMEGGDAVVVKFYRPGRWSREALHDEHDFLFELADADVPVIAPLKSADGSSLDTFRDMHFAIFPKKGGRICDEPDDQQWKELGRLIARVHSVGETRAPRDRITMSPDNSVETHLHFILDADVVSPECRREFEMETRKTVDMIRPLFDEHALIRIHGDCHHQNIIHRPGESFYMIDFDDMALGPAVQDVWMLLPGRLQDARREMSLFLEGYETFRELDRSELLLIEPLRAMRYLHFTAWCARQMTDGGFKRLSPDWGSSSFWKQEIHEFQKQQVEIKDALDAGVPYL